MLLQGLWVPKKGFLIMQLFKRIKVSTSYYYLNTTTRYSIFTFKKPLGIEVLTMICWTSLQVRLGFDSKAKAIMAAAIVQEALVPSNFVVHFPFKSVVTTFLSFCSGFVDPELNVVAKIDEQVSVYHGTVPFSETLVILTVYLKGMRVCIIY